MSLIFTVPISAAKYISLQRLETQSLGNAIHYNALGKLAYHVYEKLPITHKLYRQYSVHVEPRLRGSKIVRQYGEIMQREFDTIKSSIDPNCSIVMGIGPGVAGLEVMLSNFLQDQGKRAPHIILLDKNGIDPIRFGYHETAAVYNSLDLAKEVLVSNGHPAESVTVVEADDASSLTETFFGRVDLVTSLIAWGFHFPVSVYLDLVVKLLAPTGCIIQDIRKGTDGLDAHRRRFTQVETIYEDAKFERVLARNKIAES